MRLIDADHVLTLEEMQKMFTGETCCMKSSIQRVLSLFPTVDAVPAVHAHWDYIENVVSYEGTFDGYECSHCHEMFLDDMCQNNGSDYVDAKKDFKYCPFCGARMDEEEER